MKKNAIWIMAVIVVTLMISSLLWSYSMETAGGVRKKSAAHKPEIVNFDIRDIGSKDAVSKFEQRMQKISSKLKEKNSFMKQAMKDAKGRKAKSTPGLDVNFCPLTNCPEVVEMKGKGRKFLTPSSSQPREN